MLVDLPHSTEELALQHFLKSSQLSSWDLATVFTLLELLQQLTGSLDVGVQGQRLVHLCHWIGLEHGEERDT